MDWFNTAVLAPTPSSCSSGFLLYVGSAGTASPRNAYLEAPSTPPLGFSNGRLSVFSGAPDHVFPVGQVGSVSAITNHTEMLPVTVDVMAARGCDGLIARLALDLVKEGLVVVPQVGAGLDGGEILMRRDVEEWV